MFGALFTGRHRRKRTAVLWGMISFTIVATAQVSDQNPIPTSMKSILKTHHGHEALEADRNSKNIRAPTFEEEVVVLVNQERWNNGQLPPLKKVDLLDDSSVTHSTAMGVRNFFAHCDLDTGQNPGQRITAAGYNWNAYGENIAAGQSTPASVMASWMASSGHRANILSVNFREIGVGYYYDSVDTNNVRLDQNGDCVADSFGNGPYFRYWTQNFGQRNNVYPVVINREEVETNERNVSLYVYGQTFAIEMRIRNENGTWTPWQTFAADVPWSLSFGDGLKEVFVEIRDVARIGGFRTVLSASDTIELVDSSLCDFPSDYSIWPESDIRDYIPCYSL